MTGKSPEGPQDPISKISAGFLQLHEIMLEAERVGFTHEEAFQMLLVYMNNTENLKRR
jgi:hypothetical protein